MDRAGMLTRVFLFTKPLICHGGSTLTIPSNPGHLRKALYPIHYCMNSSCISYPLNLIRMANMNMTLGYEGDLHTRVESKVERM